MHEATSRHWEQITDQCFNRAYQAVLHQASLIDQVASQPEAMPCRAGWMRWPNGPHTAMAGVLRQVVETLESLENFDLSHKMVGVFD